MEELVTTFNRVLKSPYMLIQPEMTTLVEDKPVLQQELENPAIYVVSQLEPHSTPTIASAEFYSAEQQAGQVGPV